MIILLLAILTTCLINGIEKNDLAVWITKATRIIPFDGWLVKDVRVKELLKTEEKYSILETNFNFQKNIIDLYSKDKETLQDNIVKLSKRISFLLDMNKIWITTSIICISFTVISILGLVAYFTANYYLGEI